MANQKYPGREGICQKLLARGITPSRFYSVLGGQPILRDHWQLPIIAELSGRELESFNLVENKLKTMAREYNKKHPFKRECIERLLHAFREWTQHYNVDGMEA